MDYVLDARVPASLREKVERCLRFDCAVAYKPLARGIKVEGQKNVLRMVQRMLARLIPRESINIRRI